MTVLSLVMALANRTASGPSTYWISTISGAETHAAAALSKNAAGNVYLIGSETTSSTPTGVNIDGCVVQSNGAAVSQFTAGFGYYGETDYGVGIAHDTSDNSHWLGKSKQPSGDGTFGAYVAKKNNSETIQWERYILGMTDPTAIAVTSSSQVLVVDSTGPRMAYLDSNGLLASSKIVSAGAFFGLMVTGTDSYSVGCTATGANVDKTSAAADIYIAKGSIGDPVFTWQRSLSGSTGCCAYSACVDTSGNIIVGGICDAGGTEGIVVAKYSSAGTLSWQRKIATGGTAGASYITPGGFVTAGASGSVYVCGTINNGDSTYSIWIGKLDSSGTLSWQRKLRPTGLSAWGRGIYRDSGGLYIAGSMASTMLLARLPDDGTLTGTHGAYTYAAATQTDSAAGLTTGTPAYTSSNAGLTYSTVVADYGAGVLSLARQPVD